MQDSVNKIAAASKKIADKFENGTVPIEMSGWLPVEPLPRLPVLREHLEVDFVVIGAGLAGASTFMHLCEDGAQAILLEAGQPANGASGRNAGHYLPYLDDLKTLKSWPGNKGERFFQYCVENRSIAYEICAKYGLDADCKQLGMVVAGQGRIKELAEKPKFWSSFGYEVEEVGPSDLSSLLGTEHFKYGLRWREGGRVNPYLLTNGMVSAGVRLGGRAFGDSPVQSCVRENGRWRINTPTGSVVTRRVILCTNGNAGNNFFPEVARTSYPMIATALATKPLPPELARKLAPSGAIVEQYPGLYHMLLDGRDRLISSTIPGVGSAHDAEKYFKVFLTWMRKAFPVARDFPIELEAYWSGIMHNSSAIYHQDYPNCFDLGDGAYALVNLGSWGNFMGPMLGKSLGHALAADRPDDFVLPLKKPVAVQIPGLFSFQVRRLGVPALRVADRLGLV